MENFDFTIKGGSGKYTDLDKEYNKYLIGIMQDIDDEGLFRWETYNVIMEELLNMDLETVFNEVKYRLTDGDNPNEVMLDVITRVSDSPSGLLWLMKKRIEDYIDEDFYNQFY